ncbi:MAG TPA: hypothetical protein VFP10_11905 [Candidatus Eisenbacteria bacterium]|nr:hypothetical protein [Candidatus Eisenbacteria bacterium]
MDALREHDVETGRLVEPSERLAQALELMTTGIRLKRISLRRASPEADEQEIERAVEKWLFSDG